MRFFFDEHVSQPAAHELVRRGIDVEHVLEVGMKSAKDPAVLDYAIEHGRILVTRNYRDFAPLVEALNRQGRTFPGVLFIPHSISQSDTGGHVRAIESWLKSSPPDLNPAENTFIWLW